MHSPEEGLSALGGLKPSRGEAALVESGAGAPDRGASRSFPYAVLATVRPRQWAKNALVIAAAGAAGALGDDEVLPRIAVAFVAFCMLASAVYSINDVRDAAEDRKHPRKRHRPVAARELAPASASLLGVGLMIIGLALCVAVAPLLAVVGAAYLTLTLTYTVLWRYIPLLDITAIAGGFVLRAVAGGVAAPVTLSRWFVMVITCAAFFVAAGKRHSELSRANADGTTCRRVLERYNERTLRLILVGSAACALFAYCVWAFQLPGIDGIPWRPLTIVPFAACLVRYGRVVRAGEGEAPEEVLLTDRWLLLMGTLWLVLFALGVHDAT